MGLWGLLLLAALPAALALELNTAWFAQGPRAGVDLYASVHALMMQGHHPAVVAAVDAALESGVPDASPQGFPVSTLSFMKGMALYNLGRIPPAQVAFAASVLAGDRFPLSLPPKCLSHAYPHVLMRGRGRQPRLWGCTCRAFLILSLDCSSARSQRMVQPGGPLPV